MLTCKHPKCHSEQSDSHNPYCSQYCSVSHASMKRTARIKQLDRKLQTRKPTDVAETLTVRTCANISCGNPIYSHWRRKYCTLICRNACEPSAAYVRAQQRKARRKVTQKNLDPPCQTCMHGKANHNASMGIECTIGRWRACQAGFKWSFYAERVSL